MNLSACIEIKYISKLISYVDAGKLAYRLKWVSIKAIQYNYGGQLYVKLDKLIAAIRDGMRAQQEIAQLNPEHAEPFPFGLMNTRG